MKKVFCILKNLIFFCPIDISFMFKMKLSVQIRTYNYIVFMLYPFTKVCYMELRNHIDLLIYLVIYMHFLGLHG